MRCLAVLLALILVAPAAQAQSIFVPAERLPGQRAPDESARDPSTGFILPPEGAAAPAPGVNWDPPADTNPNRPFMRSLPALENELSVAMRDSCGVDFIRVEFDRASFENKLGAQSAVRTHTSAMLSGMRNVCQDNRIRAIVDELFSALNVVHTPGQLKPLISADGYVLTMRYDFASLQPLTTRLFTPELMAAISSLVDQYDARINRYNTSPRVSE